VTYEDRRRAGSFGEDAEQYDRARPSYPPELVEDLAGPDVHRVLDVGCGTGIAARLFAARGCSVFGVEPDARMAAVAQRHGIEVAVAAFEAWDPPPEAFDLVICAQAWHWVDPGIGPVKAGTVLRPGGRFAAFWNSYAPAPEMQAALTEIYQRYGQSELLTPAVSAETRHEDRLTSPLQQAGMFEAVDQRRYPWRRVYRRDEWLEQLATQSHHRTMAPDTLQGILAEIGTVIDRLGGQITVDHTTLLITARRRP
jgi:SAM-dependent methyltransferase